ncbi:hypothetical protein GTH32_12925 [Alteromonas sp. 345S023]|uniref:Uncharacterized protein n=1 Tax=Alteromonas profundi TaxID=2696062 RepID=A0A7X5LMI4_9ALTE|nr:hypothetical protein [Alteromonas profundi]NDV92076.1 hypothetical protein [Alteromonas profundi]
MSSDSTPHTIANMAGLKSAIVRGESDRVSELLGDQTLDKLQKSYLIELAELNGNPSVVNIVKQAPSKE